MNKIFLISTFLSLNLFAGEPGVAQYGRIVDLKGSGFISYNGKTREIKKGDTIEVGADIVIEHHGQVSFTDNADHRFHLGNSSSVSVAANSLELRGGDLWFQSLNKNDDYKVKTANAFVNYQGGEGILSYDSVKGKTQLMVINSMMKLSNLRAPELNLNVSEGHFSFVDNSYEEGAPRDPTPVGEKTYGQLVGLFSGIAPMDKNAVAIFKDHDKSEHSAKRTIASVEPAKEEPKIGEDHKMMDDYKSSLFKKPETKKIKIAKITKKSKKSAAQIAFHVYGLTNHFGMVAEEKEGLTLVKTRAPASVIDEAVPSEPIIANPYNKDYKNKYKESDKLIEDLNKL